MPEVPADLRGKLEPAEIFHEVLEHRWFMSERAAASVAVRGRVSDYVGDRARRQARREGRARARVGTPSDDTAALRIVLPPEETA